MSRKFLGTNPKRQILLDKFTAIAALDGLKVEFMLTFPLRRQEIARLRVIQAYVPTGEIGTGVCATFLVIEPGTKDVEPMFIPICTDE
jgi:hypothetical protein